MSMNVAGVQGNSLAAWRQYNTAKPAEAPEKLAQGAVHQEPVKELASTQQVAAPANAQAAPQQTVSNEELTAWLEGLAEAMTASAAPTRAPVAAFAAPTGSNAADLYEFANQYLYGTSSKTWARIDSDQNGVWSRQELTDYADAYEQATGRALDVNALMAKYGNASDEITYAKQQEMYADDALGISYANRQLALADLNLAATSSGGGRINESALNDFVNNFTYGTGNSMRPNLDKNQDGVWTFDELTEYAKAYQKATGVTLDVEALWAKYDKDGNGVLKYSEQNEMIRDDALGLSRIKDALADVKASEGGKDTGKGKDTDVSNWLKDLAGSMSSSGLRAFSAAMSQNLQKSALLSAFMMTTSAMYGGYNSTNAYTAIWNTHNYGLLNLFA